MSTLTLGSFFTSFHTFLKHDPFPAFSLALQSCTDAMRSWTPWCECSRVHRGPCYRVGWIVVDLPGDVGTLHSYLNSLWLWRSTKAYWINPTECQVFDWSSKPNCRRNMKQNGFGVNIYLSFLGDLWSNFAGRTWIWPRKSWSRQVGRSRWEEKRSPLILQIYKICINVVYNVDELQILILQSDGDYIFAMTYGFPISPQTCQVHVIVTVPEKWVMSSVTKDQRWGGDVGLCWVLRLQLVQRDNKENGFWYFFWVRDSEIYDERHPIAFDEEQCAIGCCTNIMLWYIMVYPWTIGCVDGVWSNSHTLLELKSRDSWWSSAHGSMLESFDTALTV